MAGDEPVTSPDQHRPTVGKRLTRFGAVFTILVLLAMTIGNHGGNVENIFLIGIAGLIALMLVVDFVLRRSGLRSE